VKKTNTTPGFGGMGEPGQRAFWGRPKSPPAELFVRDQDEGIGDFRGGGGPAKRARGAFSTANFFLKGPQPKRKTQNPGGGDTKKRKKRNQLFFSGGWIGRLICFCNRGGARSGGGAGGKGGRGGRARMLRLHKKKEKKTKNKTKKKNCGGKGPG